MAAVPSAPRRAKRPKTRPLGYVPVKAPCFLQREKTEFREGLKFISDIIQHGDERSTRNCSSAKNPFRMNNANIARYHNFISDRVIGSQLRENDGLFRQISSLCGRRCDINRTSMSNLQCEVLGPFFCTDCSRMRRQDTTRETHRALYPQIDVHQRALVAPDKVLQFNASLPGAFFKNKRVLACGCVVNIEEEFHNPVIYTQHDVHDRVRHAHKAGCSLLDKKTIIPKPKKPPRLDFVKQEPYNMEDMRVSVHFNSPTEEGKQFFLT